MAMWEHKAEQRSATLPQTILSNTPSFRKLGKGTATRVRPGVFCDWALSKPLYLHDVGVPVGAQSQPLWLQSGTFVCVGRVDVVPRTGRGEQTARSVEAGNANSKHPPLTTRPAAPLLSLQPRQMSPDARKLGGGGRDPRSRGERTAEPPPPSRASAFQLGAPRPILRPAQARGSLGCRPRAPTPTAPFRSPPLSAPPGPAPTCGRGLGEQQSG